MRRPPFADLLVTIQNAQAVLASAPQPRKFVVYVSEDAPELKGVPKWSPPPATWAAAFEELRRSGVPVYPIDPVTQMVICSPPCISMPPGFDFVSESTGGRSVVHPGDPVATATDLMAENGSYYLLGYYPTPFARDGKFHPVSVSVNRPGLHVRAREGYWALDSAPVTAAQGVNAALGAGLDNPGLPIAVFAAPTTPSGKGMRTIVVTSVTYPENTPAAFDDEWRIGIVAADPDASVKAQQQLVVPVHHTGSTSGTVSVSVDTALDLPEQQLMLRVAVASQLQRTTGTAHLKVDVPSIQSDGPEIGGVLIRSSQDSQPPAQGWNDIQALVPFQPTTDRTFTTSDELRVFAYAYWKSKGPDSGAEAILRILGSETSRTVPLAATHIDPGRLRGRVDSTVPLAGLAPGVHVLQVEVREPNRPPALRSVVFDIK